MSKEHKQKMDKLSARLFRARLKRSLKDTWSWSFAVLVAVDVTARVWLIASTQLMVMTYYKLYLPAWLIIPMFIWCLLPIFYTMQQAWERKRVNKIQALAVGLD